MNNTWFSLKDVMELILLHTQQIHALQTTHEERIQALSQVGREDQEKAEFDAMNVTDRQFDAATSMSNTRQNSKGSWSRNPSANMGRLNGRQSARGSQSRSFSNPGTARVPITIVEGSHNSSGSAYSKGKGAQEPKSFKLSDATLEVSTIIHVYFLRGSHICTHSHAQFFNRLNQFIATKTAKRTKLSTAVRRCETAQTEAKLRSLNQYSRKGSYESEIAKKVFSLNKLDDVRQQQMSQIPVLPPQERRREPLGAFAAHVAAPSESFSEMVSKCRKRALS